MKGASKLVLGVPVFPASLKLEVPVMYANYTGEVLEIVAKKARILEDNANMNPKRTSDVRAHIKEFTSSKGIAGYGVYFTPAK